MASSFFLDTSYVIALINRRDQYHAQALHWADTYDGAPFVTTEAVLLEIGNALAGAFKAEAVALIDAFRSDDTVEVVTLTPQLFEAGLDLYRSHLDQSWGLVDCLSFVVMRDRGVQRALSFDHHFSQAGFWLPS